MLKNTTLPPIFLIAWAALLAFAQTSAGQNLLANPGFETGNATGCAGS